MPENIPYNEPVGIDPQKVSPVRRITPPSYGFNPFLSRADQEYQELKKTDTFLQSLTTPDAIDEYKNYILATQFKEFDVESPFQVTGEGRAIFDTGADFSTPDANDTPEQKAGKELRNYLIAYKGKIPSPNPLRSIINNSMTAGWVKMLSGQNMADVYDKFNITESGISFDGQKLNLNNTQSQTIMDFMSRATGADIPRTFFDKVVETAASLTVDLPLLYLTGGISAGVMNAGSVTRALMGSNKIMSRFTGQVLQQAVNFNLLGVPQTVASYEDRGVGGALESVYHNVAMGTLAAGTGTAGVGLGKAAGDLLLKRNPAIREELSGLIGSFGFGYLSGKAFGESDSDAIATGLGFAATHFTNPRAYKRIIQEQTTKPIRIVTEKGEYVNGKFAPDYFVEKNGKLEQIDKRALQEDGRIVRLDVEPLEITSQVKENMIYYNELPNQRNMSFSEALLRDRQARNGKKLFQQITKNLPTKFVVQNEDRLRTLSEIMSTILVGNKISKVFGAWELPDNLELRKDITRVVNKNKIPYDSFKEWLINDIKDYIKDPIGYKESLETYSRFLPATLAKEVAYKPEMVKDMLGVIEKLAVTIMPNENLSDYNNRLLPEFTSDKIRLPNGIMYAKPKPVIAEEIKSEKLKAGDTVKFESAGEEQAGKIKAFTNEYKNVDVELKDGRTVNLPINKLLEVGKKPAKEKTVEKPVEKVEEPPIVDKVKEDVSKSEESNVIEPESKIAEKDLNKEFIEPSKQIEPTKPIEEFSQEELTSLKNPIVETIDRNKGKGFTITDEGIKEPLTQIYEKASKLAEQKNKELMQDTANLNKDMSLNKKKAWDAEHFVVKMLATNQPQLSSQQVARILEQMNPRYKNTTGEDVDNMFRPSGKLKNVDRFAKTKTVLPEKPLERPATESDEIAANMMREIQEKTQMAGKEFQPEAEMMKTGQEFAKTEIEKAAITKEDKLGKALEDFIVTTAPDRGSGKTIEQVIKEQSELGNITKEEANYIENMFGGKKGVVKLFETGKAEIVAKHDQKVKEMQTMVDALNKRLNEYGVTAKIKAIEQPADMLAEGKFIRGVTTIHFSRPELGIEITIDPYYGRHRTIKHEEFHALTTLVLDQALVNRLLKKYGFNGNAGEANPSWVIANERLTESYLSWLDGTGTKQQGFEKMRTFFEKMANFFKGNGYATNEYRFFRDLVDGRIKFTHKYISPEVRKNYDTKTNKMVIEDVQRLYEISDGVAEGLGRKMENFGALREWDANYSNNKLDNKKFFDKFAKSALNDIPSKLWDKTKRLWLMNEPPDYVAKWMSRHKEVYDIGNEFISIKSREAANNNMSTNWDVRQDGKSKFYYTPDEVKAGTFDKIHKYRDDMYEGKLERRQTFEEVYKKYGFTPEQVEIIEAWRGVKNEGIRQQIEAQRMRYMEETENLAAELNSKRFKEFFPEIKEDAKEPLNEAREILKTDELRKEAIADFLLEGKYEYKVKDENGKVIGDAFYYPFTRKSSPDTWLIEMVNAEGKRRSMDADSEKEANAKVEEWKAKGYDFPKPTEEQLARGEVPLSFYRIGDIISQGQFWNRLSERQLYNLASLGHIPFNEPVLKKLREAMKAGKFEQHTLETDFIPGVELDAKRFEQTIREFADISAGGYRLLGNLKMNKAMEQWAKEKNILNASTKTPAPIALREKYGIKGETATKSELRNIQNEFDYSAGYVNNITHSDKSVVDGFRKLASIWMLGVKPSFIFQQPFQLPQKVLPLAIAESNKNGNKLFWEALVEAPKLGMFIRANQKGLSEAELSKFGFDKELYGIYLTLKQTGRAGKSGIEELTDKMGDIEYRYEKGFGKGYETLSKLASMPAGVVEKFTRVMAVNMFYKIGKEKNLSGKELSRYVSDKVDLTMDLWGAHGRAPLFASKELGQKQGTLLKALDKSFMTFKTYATHNLAQYEYLMRNRQWKALAVKTAVGVGIHGATKFPLMAGMFALADLFSDDDTEYEILSEIDKLNMYIPGLGSTLSRGVFANMGLNVSNLLDERTIFPTDLVANLAAYSPEGMAAEALMGAPYGLAQDYIDGAKAVYDFFGKKLADEPMVEKELRHIQKQFRKLLPLALRNIFEAMVWERDGVTIRNNVIIKKDDLSWRDVFYKALSFQPLDVNKKTEELIFGFPNKFKRVEGEIAEIRRVRKDITRSDKYTAEEKSIQLIRVKEMLEDAMKRRSLMMRTQDYRDAIKAGLIK